jgi:hypothetical protein
MQEIIKKDLKQYYDSITNQITSKAKNLYLNSSNNEINKQEIIEANHELVEKLDELFESNCIELDQFYFGKTEEDGDEVFQQIESDKINALRNYCMFLDGDNLTMKETNKFGLLVVTNWYMTQNQLDYIK